MYIIELILHAALSDVRVYKIANEAGSTVPELFTRGYPVFGRTGSIHLLTSCLVSFSTGYCCFYETTLPKVLVPELCSLSTAELIRKMIKQWKLVSLHSFGVFSVLS